MKNTLAPCIVFLMGTGACTIYPGERMPYGTPGAGGDTETDTGTSTESVPEAVEGTYRIVELSVADPHTYLGTDGEDCQDVTAFLELTGLQEPIDDGELDLVVRVSRADEGSSSAALVPSDCDESGNCGPSPDANAVEQGEVVFRSSGQCEIVDPAAYNSVYGSPPASAPPCIIATPDTLELDIGADTPIHARDVAWSASVADDALTQGVLRVFVTRADARMIELGLDDPENASLWSLIAGGGACNVDYDDTDVHPENGIGVWLHLEFSAERVDWTG